MVYSEALADEIRDILNLYSEFDEKKMFGGMCFLLNGNMVCGVIQNELMVRIGKENHDEAMKDPETKEMDFTGRPMRGMLYIGEDDIKDRDILVKWVKKSFLFAKSLPSK